MKTEPLVSIAIPTYKRPEYFERALISVFNQDYENIELIVSDNNYNDRITLGIVEKYINLGKNIKYYNQEKNLGSINNLFFLLEVANGEYFMWLADDDEIEGQAYISELVSILISKTTAVTAFARWKFMDSPNSFVSKKNKDYKSKFWFIRLISFFWFANDDFFYGLHRINSLRKARILKYAWPNKQYILNWGFIYLLDQVLRGTIVQSKRRDISWVNHGYTNKKYLRQTEKNTFKSLLLHVLRRLNVYYLYLYKIYTLKGVFYSMVFLPYIILCVLKEFFINGSIILYVLVIKIFK